MDEFYDVCIVDLQLSEVTARTHQLEVEAFLDSVQGTIVNRKCVRIYLKRLEGYGKYEHALNSLHRFFRDYLNHPEIVSGFRSPYGPYRPVQVPTKDELQRFYEALKGHDQRTLFLLLASSGLRKGEALSLKVSDLDRNLNMIIPRTRSSSKHTWITFYNEETEALLETHLPRSVSEKVFTFSDRQLRKSWYRARKKTGFRITPKILRAWFCSEMGSLGVSDRYIDAFCGRVPRSVLSIHYTDFSPKRLKRIYDKAGLKVLG